MHALAYHSFLILVAVPKTALPFRVRVPPLLSFDTVIADAEDRGELLPNVGSWIFEGTVGCVYIQIMLIKLDGHFTSDTRSRKRLQLLYCALLCMADRLDCARRRRSREGTTFEQTGSQSRSSTTAWYCGPSPCTFGRLYHLIKVRKRGSDPCAKLDAIG